MINHFKYLLLILFSSISFATTIHVATTGSDDNDGSEGSPFATIQAGINAASDGDTVLVGAGTYVENLDVSIGDDYYFAGIVLCSEFVYYSDSTSIIENTIIAANEISSNYGDNTFYGFTIKDNDTPTNLNFYYSNSTFKNCFFNNVYDGGVSGTDSTVFQNCTLFNSFNDWGGRWAIVHNSILISSFNEVSFDNPNDGHNMSFTYNDLGYNENGNISDVNPLFCDSENGDYTLAANSPAIGAGEDGSNIGALGVGCEAFDLSLTINEIMNNPSAVSDSDGEWFEVYNNGDVSHDLNGWTIKDNGSDSHVISSSLVINPGEFKVLSNNSNQSTNGGLVVDYQYDGITLANGDDELVLIDLNGTVFDSVAYDGGPEFPDLNGASMGVIDSETDNNIGSNWQTSTTAYGDGDLGTPGLPNFSSDIDVELTTIDFDTVLVGEFSDKVLTISNTGNTTLLIDSIYTSSGLFTLPFTETSVETSLELNITFTPSAYGIVEDTLVIKTNDPDEGHVEISLIGLGYVPSPNIVLETTSIDFGTVMDGLTETIELHVANDGDAALSLSSVYIEGSTNFTIPTFSASIAETDTGSIDIQFSPDDETSFSGTLYIVSNDPDTDTLMVALSGIGGEQTPIMVLSDDELYFGTVQAGTTVEREVIIYNEGMLDLEIEQVTITGSDYYTTTFSDASVEPGDSVVVPFSFAPTEQVAEIIATATVASNVGTQTIELKSGYFGPVWHVATTGSDETGDGTEQNPFSTIQKAIGDMSIGAKDGDTVLVHPGIYAEDNIFFQGKNIILTSLFGVTQDTSYISSTIIDGTNNSISGEYSPQGVINFVSGEDSTAVLSGFTIKNGSTGIICGYPNNSSSSLTGSPTIKNMVIMDNYSEDTFISGGVDINSYDEPEALISKPILENVTIKNNYCPGDGGGVSIYSSNPTFINVTIYNNTSGDDGGGISIRKSNPIFTNTTIYENTTFNVGGGVHIQYSNPIFTNTTISGNISNWIGGGIGIWGEGNSIFNNLILSENASGADGSGGGIWVRSNTILTNATIYGNTSDNYGGAINIRDDSLSLVNCIIWQNFPQQINMQDGSLNMSYSNLQGGENSITQVGVQGEGVIDWGVGNIDTNPLFCDQSSGDFTLAENSPCIGFGENGTDIGALGVGCETAILSLDKELLPNNFVLYQNYPNPFNPTTKISYDLPEASVVSLSIYDLMGREIRTMINREQTAGFKNIQWNATDNLGKSVPAGMYIYTIQAGEFRQTRKMVLLK